MSKNFTNRKPFKHNLPDTWKYVKAGELLEESKVKNQSGIEYELFSVTKDRGVIPQIENGKRDTSSSNKQHYKVIEPGDIVYNTMRMWQGVVGLSFYKGIVSPAYTVLKPKKTVNPIYLEMLFKYKPMINVFYRFSQGLVNDTLNLKYEHFKNILIPLPTFNEQQKIASILSSVDEAIEKTEQIIEQTEQVKKGIMQQLLTKGVGHTEFKQTPVGDIPKGWEYSPFIDFVDINPKYQLNQKNIEFVEMAAVQTDSPHIAYFTKRHVPKGGNTRFKEGDVLFARITPCTENGKTALVSGLKSEIGMGSTEFIVFSPIDSKMNPVYLYYLVKSGRFRNKAISRMIGTTGRQRVPKEVFTEELFVPMPSLGEQKKIANILYSFDERVMRENNSLARLNNLKQGLMQQLLTGKVRVPIDEDEEVTT